ncbi:probable serine/threonine-protein kinase PBL9 isoform X2 [Trifolium pratense]|uniref:probable serine/threonine-protein kinase PBL9 isoform X2 n=1 Tax=Trifolium pratense TaxID=57577 RepID=UPI001E6917D1|nr:probable serine/threonine-protein kinase PBL9 isoform X2 [Trifolium pratense]XP_045806603.1 probable serine/threonine-protein kinase PBL9 isoform X2 [Trifolium pratense]
MGISIVSAMGACLRNHVKAESPMAPINSGLSSKSVNVSTEDISRPCCKVPDDLSSSSNIGVPVESVPVPRTARGVEEILQPSNLKCFTSTEIRAATRNFHVDSVLGDDSIGSVFKGWIDEHSTSAAKPGKGIVVAVKRLNHDGFKGHKDLLAEANYLGQLSHPHLVKLIGYCIEDENSFMVYEFMPRGSLENHLFIRGSYFQHLSWNLRLKVAFGAAKGLAFLHSAKTKATYRDFKTSNVLLDSNYNAKLSNFGLAKGGTAVDKSRLTYGYAAPEYLATGNHSAKSDVYSFGVVLLEILSGRRVVDKNRPQRQHNLVEWAKPYLSNKRKILRVLDNRLEGQYELEDVYKVAILSLRCLSIEAKLRPKMDEVVTNLEQLQVPNVNGCNQNRLRRRSTDDVPRVRTAAAYPQRSTSMLCT